MKGILGKKMGMSQLFLDDGKVVPVTLIEAGPCTVVQIKTKEKDGYQAVQLGFGEASEGRLTQPVKGHFAKSGVKLARHLAELRVDDPAGFTVGQEIKADVFSEGEYVDVSGTTKGKGFAGVIKRWGFHGRPASHGHHYHRAPGSIGASATPSRVVKGKKLPGRLGGGQATTLALQVVKVEAEQNLLVVKGAVPGAKGSLLLIREASRVPKSAAGKRTEAKTEVKAEEAKSGE